MKRTVRTTIFRKNWELQEIVDYAEGNFLHEDMITKDDLWGKEKEEIIEFLMEKVVALYDEREEEIGAETMREFEKVVVLRAVDSKWMDHIDAMDQLRQGIHLRAYGGTDPLREYQFEGFEMFKEMIEHIQEEVTKYIMKAHVENNLERQEVAKGQTESGGSSEAAAEASGQRKDERVKRNDPAHAAAARNTSSATDNKPGCCIR